MVALWRYFAEPKGRFTAKKPALVFDNDKSKIKLRQAKLFTHRVIYPQ
jgi:hypothetical protein